MNTSSAKPNDQRSSTQSHLLRLAGIFALVAVVFLAISVTLFGVPHFSAQAAGSLTVQITAAYNLVVDSNVLAPSTYAPAVATVGGKVCNNSGEVVTGVQIYIGNYNNGTGSTPGIYPARNSADPAFAAQFPQLANTGFYSFTHLGGRTGLADAARYVGTLAPGQCQMEYWHFLYPRRSNGATPPYTPNAGNQPTWGETRLTSDDLSLRLDIWASGQGVVTANVPQTMTVRNEISAMANKIKPNPDGAWFNTNTNVVEAGDVITSNGILYELGVVNQGFDNDGNFTPDFNAWVQPIGDPSYDPSCFRLIRVSGVITASRGGGNPDTVIPFTDQMYFTNLPSDNNGVRGLVFYTFQALGGVCATSLSPYQEVASGSNNEKFNGDYGAGIPPLGSSAPDVAIDKTGNVTTTAGGRITYTIAFNNINGTQAAGLPLINGALTFSDTLPISGSLVSGSLTATVSSGGSVGILYSTDRGITWSPAEPTPASSVNTVRIFLNEPLPVGATGRITYSISMSPLFPPPGTPPLVTNCAGVSFGQAAPFATDCTSTLIQGTNVIGDWVWRDENRNGTQDDGATGISGVPVSLYYDLNGNGVQDTSDMFIMSATTSITGWYQFTQVPNGNFIVAVDSLSSAIPQGYTNSTPNTVAVTGLGTTTPSPYLRADFGFAPALQMTKDVVNGGYVYEGDRVTYTIRLTNTLPGNGTPNAYCQYTDIFWAPGGTGTNNWSNAGLAFSGTQELNNLWAVNNFANGNQDTLNANNYSPTLPAGVQLTKVEWVYYLYEGTSLAPSAVFNTVVYTNNPSAIWQTISTPPAVINQYTTGNPGYVAVDLTSYRNWGPTDPGLYRIVLDANRGTNASGPLNIDAMGWRLTYKVPCPVADRTIASAPLTDTFNADQLQFVTATPPQTTRYTQATPYPNTGVISWTNVGPIYPGGSKLITVTFKVLEPSAITQTFINTATVYGGQYGNGRPTNDARDDATSPVSRTTSIGDFIWRDLNSNGVQDVGEPGIPGVVISLTANVAYTYSNGVNIPAGTVVTTTTDVNGYYLFDGIRNAGTFTTRVNTSTLPTGGGAFTQTGDPDQPNVTCTTCDNSYSVAVTSQFTNVTWADFGYQLPSLIAGTIWNDLNRSGTTTPDTGEPYMAGVVVTLTVNGSFVATTTTNSAGYYAFAGTYDGPFNVTVDTNRGPFATSTYSQTFDQDGTVTPNIINGSITTGNASLNNDFSYYQTGALSIGDLVYKDWNGNATQDTGEGGISGVVAYLFRDTNNNGVYDGGDAFIMTTTTSITGWYQFAGLPGSGIPYVVALSRGDGTNLPYSYIQTQDPLYPSGVVCTACDDQGSVPLQSSSIITMDFGYRPFGYGSIGDTVWQDNNGNGLQDPGEPGLTNITVTLYVDTNGNGVYDVGADAFVTTTNTITNGAYLFSNLPAENYLVVVNTTDSDLPIDSASGQRYTPTTPPVQAVNLTLGQNYLDADFGFSPPARIGDTVYWDANGNGQQDWNENGIGSVSVSLRNATTVIVGSTVYAPGAYVLNTTTSITGYYQFAGLVPGTYTVTVGVGTLPYAATLTGDPDVTQPCNALTNPALAPYCDSATTQTLRGGQVFLNADFGYQPRGVIGDFVFNDLNGNGRQDTGEPGIAGVAVTMTNGAITFTTITDYDGLYSFSNVLPDGANWTVQFQTPPNMTPTTISNTAIVNGVGSVGTSTSVVLSGGAVTSIGGNPCTNCSLYIDSGFRLDGSFSLSGHIFYDSGNNGGIYSPPADLPYANIVVYLYDASQQLIGSTTTDSNGAYTFPNLPAGTYTVSYDPAAPKLSGMTPTAVPGVSGACSGTNCRNYSTVTITSGSVADQDFGFYSSMDFGDLPASYNLTNLDNEGPRHITNTLYLGAGVSTEGDGQESTTATGDTLDNGVSRVATDKWLPGATVSLVFTVTGGTGYLVGWFDWNGLGNFNLITDTVTFGALAPGMHVLPLTVPAGYVAGGTINARFRLYDGQPLQASPQGEAVGGEVEDYQWTFNPTAVSLAEFNAQSAGPTPLIWAMVSALGLLAGFIVYRRFRRHAA